MHWFLILFAFVALAEPVLAADGVLEINQECAEKTGCFAGDAPGFPVTIDRDQPGSYRLTSSLLNPDEDSSVILIADDHVTLDLNGFAVNGPATCTGSGTSLICGPIGVGDGVATTPVQGRSGVVVRNGIVRGNARHGVSLGVESWVQKVLVLSNGGTGILVDDRSLVADCRVDRNQNGGIAAAASSLVEANSVQRGRDTGISVRNGALLSTNAVFGNGGTGIDTATNSTGGTLLVDNAVGFNGAAANLHAADGYVHNVFTNNGSTVAANQVSGGVRLGTTTNLCQGVACP